MVKRLPRLLPELITIILLSSQALPSARPSCLSACSGLEDALSRQPDLVRLRRDLPDPAAGELAAQIRRLETLIEAYRGENQPRLAGLASLRLAVTLSGTEPERALELLAEPAIYRQTALGEAALRLSLELARRRPDSEKRLAAVLGEAAARGPFPAEASRTAIQACLELGRADLARTWLGNAGSPHPAGENARAWAWAWGEVLRIEGRKAEAARMLGVAIREPADPARWRAAYDSWVKLGGETPLRGHLTSKEICRLTESFVAAKQNRLAWLCATNLERSARSGRGRGEDRYWYGKAAWLNGHSAEAARVLGQYRADSVARQADVLAMLALIERKRGHRPGFEKHLHALKAKAPHSESYLGVLQTSAFDAEVAGDEKLVRNRYQEITARFPESPAAPEAVWKLAWLDYTAGRWGDAGVLFLKSFQLDQGGEFGTGGLFWHGVCLERSGRPREAAACFRALEELFPHSYYAVLAGVRMERAGLKDLALGPAETAPWRRQLAAKYLPEAASAPAAPVSPGVVEAMAAGLPEEAYRLALRELDPEASRPCQRALLAVLARERGDTFRFIYNLNRACPELFTWTLGDAPRDLWLDLFPVAYLDDLRRLLKESGLDPYLVLGLIRQESAFSTTARSVSDAIGLMQLLPSTAAEESRFRGSRAELIRRLEEPLFNLELGCGYLEKMRRQLDGQIPLALASYNGGATRIRAVYLRYRDRLTMAEIVEMIPMSQSRNYVKSILRNWNYYLLLYEDRPADMSFLLDLPPLAATKPR